MPITFGSVGDIISVVAIVKDLVQALGESRGSAAEYQEIIRELSVLDRVLLEVEQLSKIKEQGVKLDVLYTTVDHIVNECRNFLRNFLEKCQKYDPSLGEGKKGNLVRDVSRKIQWRLLERHELDKFRSDINGYSSFLSILLTTANVTISDIGYQRLEERQAAAEERAQADHLAQKTMLGHIQDRLQENTQLVASISSNAASIVRLLSLGWLRRIGLVVKEQLADIMTVNMSIYQTVIRIQAAIPYISQGPISEIFMLEDAIGRTTPVTLQFINSWDAFDSVLETRFRNLPGHQKVLQKEFVLQERATMRDISRVGPWEGAILPGQKIDMSMIFTDTRSKTRIPCPGCSHACDNYSDAGTQCVNCGMLFHRVIDISDSDNNDDSDDSDDGQQAYQSQSTKVKNSHNSQAKDTHPRSSRFGKTAPNTRGFGRQRSRGTGVQPTDEISRFKRVKIMSVQPKDEISRFKRVRIICLHRLGRDQIVGSLTFATAKQKVECGNRMDLDSSPHDPDGDSEPVATDYIDGLSLAPLTNDVCNYVFENGRRYHNLYPATYHLPNDKREQERLELQYAAIALLVDKSLFLSPIKNPKAILDQGTGTGLWAIDVGDAYPTAQVYGTDISPIQPSFVPPNVQFIVDDMELPWLYDENSLDLIHSCMGNAFSSRDWDHFLTESWSKLAPGGWVEIKDIDFTPLSQGFSLPQDSHIMRWHKLLEEASLLAGNINFHFDAARLASHLQSLGFINITIKTFRIPLGRLQWGRKSDTTRVWWREVFYSSLEPYSMALFTKFLRWSERKVERFLVDVESDMKKIEYHWDWQL